MTEAKDLKRIVLVVTGSIAAGKAPELIAELQDRGYGVDVLLTKAPELWQFKPKWVPVDTLRRATQGAVLTESAPLVDKQKLIACADAVLVAPASADFLSQLVRRSSDLSQSIMTAHDAGTPCVVAPAMNVCIWERSSVGRNCALLEREGVLFLGPVEGPMACGDYGYGRMMKVGTIAEGMEELLCGRQGEAFACYAEARRDRASAPERPVSEGGLLTVITGETTTWEDIRRLVDTINAADLKSTYVLAPSLAEHQVALEKITGQQVAFDHYQVEAMEGLEHIRMPEKVTCVYYPFADAGLVRQMLDGASQTLALDIGLASKAPLAVTPSTHGGPDAEVMEQLKQDGISVVSSPEDLVASSLVQGPNVRLRPAL